MNLTTLCYIEQDDSYLMLHRVKKEHDLNKDKWIGVGGKFETGESPEDCLLREVREETGLRLTSYRFRGIVTFCAEDPETGAVEQEYMHLFTADAWEGTMKDCDEGELVWVKKNRIGDLNLWEGDRIFLKLLAEDRCGFFSLKLMYAGDTLTASDLKTY